MFNYFQFRLKKLIELSIFLSKKKMQKTNNFQKQEFLNYMVKNYRTENNLQKLLPIWLCFSKILIKIPKKY